MPLRCLDHHGTTIEANDFTDDEWQALRLRSRSEVHLRMPCCSTRAVLKTSPLGTRFFAHKARSSCNWKRTGTSRCSRWKPPETPDGKRKPKRPATLPKASGGPRMCLPGSGTKSSRLKSSGPVNPTKKPGVDNGATSGPA